MKNLQIISKQMIIDVEKKMLTGYIDSTYKGKNVRLFGKVDSINESNLTATMTFENGVVESGIPLEAIILDEGAIDWIKKSMNTLGEKVSSKFKLVAGYCRTVWNGVVLPIVNSIMIGQLAQKKLLPAAVGFYPSDDALEEAKNAGVSISSKDAELDEDASDINAFWRKIVDGLTSKNESGTEATLEDVKNAYLDEVAKMDEGQKMCNVLKHNKDFNDFFRSDFLYENYFGKKNWNRLLEFVSDGKDPGLESYKSENIPEMGLKDIVRNVMTQLKLAFREGEFNFDDKEYVNSLYNSFIEEFKESIASEDPDLSDEEILSQAKQMARQEINAAKKRTSIEGLKPLMIWGAPGIGKTSIIQQTRAMFAEATGGRRHINMLEVVLSKMEHDDFGLPSLTGVGANNERRAEDAPQSWLPIWKKSGNAEEDARRNHAANMMGNRRENFNFDSVKGDVSLTNDKFGKVENPHVGEDVVPNAKDVKTSDNGLPADIPPTGKPNSRKVSEINGETYWYQPDGNVRPTPVKIRKKNLADSLFTPYHDEMNEGYDFFMDSEGEQENNIITDGGILFFDELTRAKKGVMNVVMNLINDRKYGEGWVLGSHWIIVCAGNRFYEMTGIENTWEKAFGTRFTQMTFVPKFEDWVKWAQGFDLDPATAEWKPKRTSRPRIDQDIIDFLVSRKSARGMKNNAWNEEIDDNGVDQDKAAKLYANPRSWEHASRWIYDMAVQANGGIDKAVTRLPKGDYYNLPLSQKLQMLAQTVGMGNSTYGGFADYHESTKFFNPGMIDSIWKFGTITGKKPTGQMDYKDVVPRDPRTGKPAGMSEDLLQKYAKEVLDGYPNDWKDITTQEICNMLSYFISILKIRHGDDTIIRRIILPHIGKYIVTTGAEKAKGMNWGDPDDPAFAKFIDPIVDLVFAFELPGHIDKDTNSKKKAEEYVDYVDDPKGEKAEDLVAEV